MRFCLSLTAHYSILHLTGSASFTDDPFNKCFSEKFLLAENVEFFNVFCLRRRTEKSGWVFMFFCLWRKRSAACRAMTSSLCCQPDSENSSIWRHVKKQKGVAGGFRTDGLLCVSVPKKVEDGAKSTHECMEECYWEQQKGLDGTCGSGLTVTSLTESGGRREEAKAEPSFREGFIFFYQQWRGEQIDSYKGQNCLFFFSSCIPFL